MSDPHATVAIADMESQRFGRVVARHPALAPADLAAADAFCRRAGVALLITRCATADSASLAALQADSFQVMDTLVRWRRAIAVGEPLSSGAYPDIVTRPLDTSASGVAEAVVEITQAAFETYNGHFHADRRLAAADATATYTSWAARSLRDASVAEMVLGADWQGVLAGFVTLKGEADGVWDVPLAAVAPRAQRQGVLTALLATALGAAQQRGAKALEYGCVVANIGAQKALVRLGFEVSASNYTLHKWFEADA